MFKWLRTDCTDCSFVHNFNHYAERSFSFAVQQLYSSETICKMKTVLWFKLFQLFRSLNNLIGYYHLARMHTIVEIEQQIEWATWKCSRLLYESNTWVNMGKTLKKCDILVHLIHQKNNVTCIYGCIHVDNVNLTLKNKLWYYLGICIYNCRLFVMIVFRDISFLTSMSMMSIQSIENCFNFYTNKFRGKSIIMLNICNRREIQFAFNQNEKFVVWKCKMEVNCIQTNIFAGKSIQMLIYSQNIIDRTIFTSIKAFCNQRRSRN